MRRVLTFLLAVAAFAAAGDPASAASSACGLPETKPLWIDYGTPELISVFGRPGVIVAGSGVDYPTRARAAGAKTVYWDMYLSSRVGTPMKPADAGGLPAKAQRVFDFAVLSAGCPDPVIVMNELFGASTPTPWTPTTARYRANVLEWARLLKEKGGQPLLLVSSEPFTGGDAGTWWRELSQVADIALEKYFNAPAVQRAGPELGSRRMRTSMRDSLAKLLAVGVPPAQLGCRAGLPDAPGLGRSRRARARRGLVRGREAAGARCEAGRPRAPARLRRLVGLGLLQRAGARPGQARRRLRLALGARAVAVRGRRAARAVRPRPPRRADRPARGRPLRARHRHDHDQRDRCARARDPRRGRGADDPLREARAAAGRVGRPGRRAGG